jgi:hypothetical protein
MIQNLSSAEIACTLTNISIHVQRVKKKEEMGVERGAGAARRRRKRLPFILSISEALNSCRYSVK